MEANRLTQLHKQNTTCSDCYQPQDYGGRLIYNPLTKYTDGDVGSSPGEPRVMPRARMNPFTWDVQQIQNHLDHSVEVTSDLESHLADWSTSLAYIFIHM